MTTDDSWIVRRGEERFYPKSLDELKEWARTGKVATTDYIFNPILRQWLYARDAPEISGFLQPTAEERRRSNTGCLAAIALCLLAVAAGMLAPRELPSCGLLSIGLFIGGIVVGIVWIVQNAGRKM